MTDRERRIYLQLGIGGYAAEFIPRGALWYVRHEKTPKEISAIFLRLDDLEAFSERVWRDHTARGMLT